MEMLCSTNKPWQCTVESRVFRQSAAAFTQLIHAVHMLSGAAGVTVVATSANFYEGSDGTPPAVTTPAAGSEDDRPLALQLRFQLPPSVYATMAVSCSG